MSKSPHLALAARGKNIDATNDTEAITGKKLRMATPCQLGYSYANLQNFVFLNQHYSFTKPLSESLFPPV